ncbi:hypothetical protein EJD97_007515 [Solanum chilense]|uniref:Uncharacterized protein n=1 Tax=Solanum chilense TaxID=4083 RepID=A0A6N2CKL9_SOLCI|nr:hypothetical protein EJD97_007515 [Solanum chilense]
MNTRRTPAMRVENNEVKVDIPPQIEYVEQVPQGHEGDQVPNIYSHSLVSNPRDEMTRFLMGVADLVKEERRTAMLNADMTLARLMVYTQTIEESKHRRMDRSLKRSGFNDKWKPRFKNRAQGQEEDKNVKVKLERGGHRVRDCPMIASRVRESKIVTPIVPKDDALTKRRFYELLTRGEKLDDGDFDEGKSLHFFSFF